MSNTPPLHRASGPDSTGVCYRHPDRPSFVLCNRCGRTVCPDCFVQAPVGVHCRECIKANRPAQGQNTAVRLWRRFTSSDNPVTLAIIAITAVVSLLQMIPGIVGNTITGLLLFAPVYVMPETGAPLEPWRMLTSALVHGGIIHLALNMYTLFIFGKGLEPSLGKWRFLALYLISAIGGAVAVTWLAAPTSAVVGASGAIFGLFGAFFVIQRRMGGDIRGLLILIGLNLVIGFIPGFNISWQGHLGGLVAGGLVGLVLWSTRKEKDHSRQPWLLAGLSVVLLLLAAARSLFPIV